MKYKVGLLVGRDYFDPYVYWLLTNDSDKFEITGIHCVAGLMSHTYGSKDTFGDIISNSDLVVSLGYTKVIKQSVIDSVPLGILNVHYSHLLKYRGRHMFSWVIINQAPSTGASLHYITPKLDDGPILATVEVPVLSDDTAGSLFDRTHVAAIEMFKENFERALDPNTKNSPDLISPSKSYKEYKAKDLQMELSRSILKYEDALDRNIRARTFPGAPKPFTVISGRKIYFSLSE